MKKSIFESGDFSAFKKASKGAKISTELRPELTTNRGFNKLSLNGKAASLMNLRSGDGVYIYANNSTATDVNSMFLIVKAPAGEGLTVSSAGKSKDTGRPVNFNYSGIWSQIIQQDVKAVELSQDALVEKGLMRNEFTQKNKRGEDCYANMATRRIKYEVVLVAEDVELDGVKYPQVFALNNAVVIDCEEGASDDEDNISLDDE